MGYFVYKLTCLATSRHYWGSTNNPIRRECEHFYELSIGNHHNKALQFDYNKYGKSSFVFIIHSSGFSSKFEMVVKEYELILSDFDINYNIEKEIPMPKKEVSPKPFWKGVRNIRQPQNRRKDK